MGGYVSAKLKSEEWGSKVVSQLSEYIRSKRPDIKGFGRSSIYNMVLFYDEYSSETFASTVERYLNSEFVQPTSAQIETTSVWQRSIYKETKDKMMYKTNKIFLFCKKGIAVHLFFDY